MTNKVKLTATDGTQVEFVDKIIGQGGMKDVYFSPDKSYVVAFFRDKQDANAKARLENIIGVYRQRLFQGPGGDYWKDLYCWPTKIVEHGGRLGIVAPCYAKDFFFTHGSKKSDFMKIKDKEKEGKWFASAKHRKNILDPREKGSWKSYLTISIKIARAVRRMHMAGLAHSDLSYKNVLIDPCGANACIIDIDGLVVPGKFPPDVLGTPDFIAPEVYATNHLKKDDPSRAMPRIETDRHALAVLIYMYLLYRHPLRGRKIHDVDDSQRDEMLGMGSEALFIEHGSDRSNRPGKGQMEDAFLPWADPGKVPYKIVGPYLSELFEQAFVDGLHNPSVRPTADAWEMALVKTVDLIQPCSNSACEQHWYVFDNKKAPSCPFCKTPYKGALPILNLYSSRGLGKPFRSDNHRLMVYHNQYLHQWHVNRKIVPGERLTAEQSKPVGYFSFHRGRWVLVNQTLAGMTVLEDGGQKKTPIEQGKSVTLVDGMNLLMSSEDGGRLVQVQMVGS
ncbi:kinase [bacterium]|nr:kinase [bacterium]